VNDIYQAPQADLANESTDNEFGSVERAIIGDYKFSIGDIVSEAWEKTSGVKWKVQLALGLYTLLYIGSALVLGGIFSALGMREVQPELENMPEIFIMIFGGGFAESILLMILLIPLGMGLMMLGLRRAVDVPIKVTGIFTPYRSIIPLVITFVLLYVLLIIGFVLLIIPGIYLSIAYYMAMILVVDKGLSPWQALETSRKAVTKNWFGFFGFTILLFVINLLGLIPLGIGLIWTIPLSLIAIGIAYRNMFGCEAATKEG